MKRIKKYLLLPLAIMVGLFAIGSLYPVFKPETNKAYGSPAHGEREDHIAKSHYFVESSGDLGDKWSEWKLATTGNMTYNNHRVHGAQDGNYYRTANLQVEVTNFLDTYEKIEDLLKENKCEIKNCNVTGNEEFRRGFIITKVWADKFTLVIKKIREMGRVKNEEIQSTLIEDPKTKVISDKGESHLVRIDLTDRPISEDRGILGNAFTKSSSNFVRGSALVVEGLGYLLPFALILSVFASMGFIGAKLFKIRKNGETKSN